MTVAAFMAAGALLFLVLAVGFMMAFPTLRRILANVEKASGNAATTWENLAMVSESAREAAADLARLARTAAENAPDIAEKVQDISENVRTTSMRVAEASKFLGLIGSPQTAAQQKLAALGQWLKGIFGR